MNFNGKDKVYIGIDQTGAINAKGIPKPLPACALIKNEVHFFYLSKLDRIEIERHVGTLNPNQTFVCLDCVLGVPDSLEYTFSEVLQKIHIVEGYGRKIASKFFREIGDGKIHHRKIEIQLKANSVFQEYPFQKNIQTGTFRFWKEISENHDDFYIPALEKQKNKLQIPLIEGYPTHIWKTALKSKFRRPENLVLILKGLSSELNWNHKHTSLVKKDPNLADAFVLAFGVKYLYKPTKSKRLNPEGQILGFEQESL